MMLDKHGTAVCRRCHQCKPAFAFYPLPYGGKGVRSVCRDCTAEQRRAQYREGSATRGRDVSYRRSLERQGVDPDEVQVMLERQGGLCAGCGRAPDRGRRLGVDLGGPVGSRLRGLLCQRCALVVGTQDDPAVLRRLALYLEGVAGDQVPTDEGEQ